MNLEETAAIGRDGHHGRERRRHERYAVHGDAEVMVSDGRLLFRGSTVDISLSGVLHRDAGAADAGAGDSGGDGVSGWRSDDACAGYRAGRAAGSWSGVLVRGDERLHADRVEWADSADAAESGAVTRLVVS